MTLADHNFWLALVLSKHVHHARAVAWLESVTEEASLAFCRVTQQGLLRLLTTDAVLRPYGVPARDMTEAWRIHDALMVDDRVTFLAEPAGVESGWRRLTAGRPASPKLWMDAYLAAFAGSAGCRLATFDQGFRQFKGLDLVLLTA